MHAQLITYQLQDISHAEYLKQMVEPDAPVIAASKRSYLESLVDRRRKKHFRRFLFMGK
jgi:hypothetical protein